MYPLYYTSFHVLFHYGDGNEEEVEAPSYSFGVFCPASLGVNWCRPVDLGASSGGSGFRV